MFLYIMMLEFCAHATHYYPYALFSGDHLPIYQEESMKLLHRSFGFIFSIAMILILFVTAFDIAVYGNYGFFQKEYAVCGLCVSH